MKLKSKLYRLKDSPVWAQIIIGMLIVLNFVLMSVLKFLFLLLYYLHQIISAFFTRKILPIIDKLNNYIYQRACQTFDIENDFIYQNTERHEVDIQIPLFLKIREYLLKAIAFLLKKTKAKLVSKNSFNSSKRIFTENKTPVSKLKRALSSYLAWFHALFRPEFD